MVSTEENIKAALLAAGFDRVGITTADPMPEEAARLEAWLKKGYAAGMTYLKRNPDLRSDPARFLERARSVVAAAAAYDGIATPEGPIAAYALYSDYHDSLRNALLKGVEAIGKLDHTAQCRISVDTAPLLERALACRAGLGWIGYSSNLITPDFGPFVQIGLIVTTLELESDGEAPVSTCEDCGRCLEACPTGALEGPYTLDAQRCISYLTIERRGPFNPWEAGAIDGWAFGCDLCTASCMEGLNLRERIENAGLLEPSLLMEDASLARLLDLCEAGFKKSFKDTPLTRCGKSGLIRNILTAARNQGLAWAPERARPHLTGGTLASRDAALRAHLFEKTP
ncbi:MAG: tRNA epoxyqueuosine(34) reductase QueG [Planctomycetota bacterium]|jgi:epoxyqueuosine reductase